MTTDRADILRRHMQAIEEMCKNPKTGLVRRGMMQIWATASSAVTHDIITVAAQECGRKS